MRVSHLLTARDRPALICLSHLRWDFVLQRPQHLLTRAAATHDVLFLEEPVFADDAMEPRLDCRAVAPGMTVGVPVLPRGMDDPATEAAQRALLDQAVAERAAGKRLVLWYYTPMALGFSAHVKADAVVYDCMDELTAFRNAPVRLPLLERQLIRRADLVFTGGRSLYEAKRRLHPDTHCFPSSVDRAHYARARSGGLADPADQAHLPRPRIGFFGVIDERLNADLLGSVALARPDWTFVILGPVVKIDPATLPRPANIAWLGMKPYGALPSYLAHWDAGWMPFARNQSTRFISPTKTPEFLAAGLPLVSTPIEDVVRDYGQDGSVSIAADAATTTDALDAALRRPRAPWLRLVDERLRNQSWDRTWASMLRLIEGVGAPVPATASDAVPAGVAAHA